MNDKAVRTLALSPQSLRTVYPLYPCLLPAAPPSLQGQGREGECVFIALDIIIIPSHTALARCNSEKAKELMAGFTRQKQLQLHRVFKNKMNIWS